MKIQCIWTGEPLGSEDFREVRRLTAPEGRIPSANTQRKTLSHALTPTGVSCRVKTFPPALVGSKAPDVLRHQPQHSSERGVVVRE